MSRYDNVQCPVCNKKFVEGDDVVVCPVCGAPHHRECYLSEGKCHFEEQHALGKQWEDRHTEEKQEKAENDPKKCPKCSAPNPPDGIFCQVCGYPMREQKTENEEAKYTPYGVPPIDITAFTTPYGGVDPEEEIDGVTAKELALFVGDNSFYYVPRIRHMKKTGKKASWNWSALFFNFMYYFNRKMYVMGALMLALYILSMVPVFVFVYHLFMRNPDAVAMGDPYMLNYNGLDALMWVSDIARYVYMGVSTVSAIFANKLYTNFVYKKIAEIRNELGNVDRNSNEYTTALSKEGRTNRALAIGSAAAVIAGFFIVAMVISVLTLPAVV